MSSRLGWIVVAVIACACSHHHAPATADSGGADAPVLSDGPIADAAMIDGALADAAMADAAPDAAGSDAMPAVCGDGVVQAGEDCDFGSGNGPGTGCEANCTFSCTMAPNSCDDANACNGTEACNTVMVSGATGQACAPGTPLADGASCGSGMICVSKTCVAARCGDGIVTAPEQCDDGAANGTPGDGCTSTCAYACVNPATDCGATPACQLWTCDAMHACQATADPAQNGMSCGTGMVCNAGTCTPTTPSCGDGIRQTGEQCDDGNTTNLDGCDASCKFEQVQRIDDMAMSYSTSTYCAKNALGGAIVGSTAQQQLDTAIQNGLADGSITIQLLSVGLDDLTGAADSALQLGLLSGTPQTGSTAYNGWTGTMGSAGYTATPDLDWWFTTDPTTIDTSARTPSVLIDGAIAAHALTTSPAAFSITVSFVGVPITMSMVDTTITATTGSSSTPLSSSGTTPGHLAAEHLDPTLKSFATMSAGQMCGKTLASSLYDVTVPTELTGCGGATNCTQCYTSANTLLDLMVSGCDAGFGFVREVKGTQPDTSANGTDTYTFTVNSTTHAVTGCKKNGAPDMLSDCVANAAYSTLYTFSSDRVISK